MPPFQQLLADLFGLQTYLNGATLHASSRITVNSVQRDGQNNVSRAAGFCWGDRQYSVQLALSRSKATGRLLVDSKCTCRAHGACEHVVAILLVMEEAGQLDVARLVSAATPVEGEQDAATRLTLQWLDALAAPAESDEEPSHYVLLAWLLNPQHPPMLSVGKTRVLKKGGYAKLSRYNLDILDLPDAENSRRSIRIDHADILPARLYLSLIEQYRYDYRRAFSETVPLTGDTGRTLLECALATGRLFLHPGPDGKLGETLQAADPAALSFRWVYDAQGRQRCTPELANRQELIMTWPPYRLDRTTHTLAPVQTDLSRTLFERLLEAPPVSASDAPLVRMRLARIAPTLPPPDAATAAAAGQPHARLVLGKGRFRHHALTSIFEEYALADLFFDYPEGKTVGGAESPATPVFRHEGKTVTRNLAAECTVWQQLQAVGLEGQRTRLPGYIRIDPPAAVEECLLPLRQTAADWVPLLTDGLPALEQAGIKVTFRDDFPHRLIEADDWFVALDEEPGSPWFDLDLGVIVAGQRISLVPPLLRLMRATPDLPAKLRGLPDDAQWPVAIDEKRILPLPAARLKAWLLPLMEFLDGDRARISRYHAGALEGLASAATQWIGPAALRDLGQRLADFSGLTPTPPAAGFATALRPYQQDGLNWLQFLREYGLSGILADDMGLGKTVQALAHLHLEKSAGRTGLPSLVVAPTSLMPNWRNEAAKFAPDLRVLTLHGPLRAVRFAEIAQADLVLTTYPLLVRDRDIHLTQQYHLLMLDEAQFIKNPKAQSHQVARRIAARHRLSLTGTPLENHLGELWAQFDFLMPGFLGSEKRFGQVFRTPIEKQDDGEARTRLAARARPFLLRRTKEQVAADLPPRTEMVRWVELEGGQRDLYESLRVAFDRKLREALAEQGVARSQIMILDALLKLRQACCDPRLVKLPAAKQLGIAGIAASAKLATLMVMLEELLDEGRKILLFSQFTSMLDLIETELQRLGIAFVRISGDTLDRETPVREFQAGRVPLFLISLKAGGTGLNLTAADTVIHYDPWWNPAVEEQATARAHRIGQEKPVFVYKLLTEGTVEEKILALQDRKRGLSDQVIQGGGKSGHLLTADDLDVLFQPLSV
jgi:superfamily II DNA or RNA helicase